MKTIVLALAPVIGLIGCTPPGPTPRSLANDALPSAEVTAFQAADARLRYRDARIEWDADNCAMYQGTAPDGRVRQEPLFDANRQRICTRR